MRGGAGHPEESRLTLREKQAKFARLLAHQIAWIFARGWEVTLADGGVTLMRKVQTSDGRTLRAIDREHMDGSLHYSRLAQDLNLFIGGEFISKGDHPVWREIGEHWEGLDPECRWGGRFKSADANHFSLAHEGKA